MVEFALVLPMLLVLLLGIADFGRVFHAGIVTESAARNGAEAAAQEYLQFRRGATPTAASDFDRITAMALEAVCDEAERLPGREMSGSTCTMPIAAVCIHDDPAELTNYSGCSSPGGVPPECDELLGLWPPLWTTDGTPEGTTLPSIEVRVCYRFDTLFNLKELQLPLANGLNIGSIWLQKGRVFTVADY
jgi:TadE-like protein